MNRYNFQNSSIVIRPAVPTDSRDISEMYKRISIDSRNAHESLSEGMFAKRGGMFEISSLDDIGKRIDDPNEKIIVGQIDGKTVSALWYGRADRSVFETLAPDPGFEKTAETVLSELGCDRMGSFKEIISLKCSASGIMPFLLNLNAALDMKNDGIERILCEIYEVSGFTDEEGCHECSLFNLASADTVGENGAVQIGISRTKTVTVGGVTVRITPHVFLWETEKTISVASDIIRRKGCTPVG